MTTGEDGASLDDLHAEAERRRAEVQHRRPHFYDGEWHIMVGDEWLPLGSRCPACNRPLTQAHKQDCIHAFGGSS